MAYRLLVDLDAIVVLDSVSKSIRMRLLDRFEKLRATPEYYSDYHEHDGVGRRVEISVFAGHCIHYWIDSADSHIKILAIVPADK